MKIFDYALDCGGNETQVYFKDSETGRGFRHDLPTDIYRAIVRAGATGLVKSVVTTECAQNRC